MSNRHRTIGQKGSTFMEILVALLVTSIGSLGAAALQTKAKRVNHESRQQLIATYLANAMVEKIRANPDAIATYAATDVGGGSITSIPSPACTASDPCTANELATYDLWLWEQELDGNSTTLGENAVGGLIQPAGCIVQSGSQIQVVVSWSSLTALSDGGARAGGVTSCGTAGTNRRQIVVTTIVG